ncbi:MAG: DsbA family protein [Alphaproteobacteria bacterium]|nr:DsbA family protein [Alphaproteobacteria bacterium]
MIRQNTLSTLGRAHQALCLAMLAIAIFATIPLTNARAQDAIDPAERQRIESIVHDYLMANPQVILDAIRSMEERQQALVEQKRADIIAQLVPTLSASPMTPAFGADDSDVILVEFFDYQCGYCKRLFPGLQETMAKDPKLKVIFAELPILGPASLVASRAALASQEQGKYMEFHDAMMGYQGQLSDKIIFDMADEVGLDVEKLKEDMNAPKVLQYLAMVRSLSESMDIRGTPAMVIGKEFIGGYIPTEKLQEIIDQARAEG